MKPGDGDSSDAQLARLRDLLGGDDRQRVVELAARLDDQERITADVAGALPAAVIRRSRQDDHLARALAPTVEKAMAESVQRNPQPLVDVIFPIMGPAIRKAIREAIAGLVASMNRNLEYTFTPRGLRWRFEAWRKKKSLAEVILTKSLVYRVDQVFLVHGESGLLLAHAARADVLGEDKADLISSMLTALQDFVRDSFGMESGEGLDGFRAGERVILVERGPRAAVAAAVRGEPGPEVRDTLARAVESIHRDFARSLSAFDGDASVFEGTVPTLEGCLEEELKPPAKNPLIPLVGAALVAGLLLWAAIGAFGRWSFHRRADRFMGLLRSEPGFVVVEQERDDGHLRVTLLRDLAARDPTTLLADADLGSDEVDFSWQPYSSPHPPFVLARARDALGWAPGAPWDLTMDQARGIVLSGAAPDAIRERVMWLAPLLPGVKGVSIADNGDPAVRAQSLISDVESRVVRFLSPAPRATEGATLDALLRSVTTLDRYAEQHRCEVVLTLRGHGPDGEGASGERTRRERAEAVRDGLSAAGLKAVQVDAVAGPPDSTAAGATEGDPPYRVSCSVEFRTNR